MELSEIKACYFVGIGGIGMSAVARYFLQKGVCVAGYDRTPSALTRALEKEGALIHYEENTDLIPVACRRRESCLVVFTPAVPETHAELAYFREQGFEVEKRAQVLGTLTRALKGLCVAGTHGKTTTSAMTAHILRQSPAGCNAFLGGISKNYGTNCILSRTSEFVVVEADEFDRSFHWLAPYATVITAVDADHLDIYGTREAYVESFEKYTSLIVPGGSLVMHSGLDMSPQTNKDVRIYTYGEREGDFHAERIRTGNGEIVFDCISPLGNISDVKLGVPVRINIENGIAAIALAQIAGVSAEDIRKAMETYAGVERRFDFKLKTDKAVLLTDYGHHPIEIRESIRSMRELYEGKKIAVVFQPHLYSRTRDFYAAFAESLSLADEVLLTDIYPAREAPLPGVTSRLIYDRLAPGVEKKLCRKEEAAELVGQSKADVFIVLGAGDIESYAGQMAEALKGRE